MGSIEEFLVRLTISSKSYNISDDLVSLRIVHGGRRPYLSLTYTALCQNSSLKESCCASAGVGFWARMQ